MVRWWPPMGLVAMLALGWAVGLGSTPIDGWFLRLGREMGRDRHWFLIFTDWRLLGVVLVVSLAVLVSRRQRWQAAALAVSPLAAVALAQLLKRLFGRDKGGGLAYPSGHVTFLVVVMCVLVVAAGGAVWAVSVAVAVSMLGMFGQAINYHYFTDTIGAALLATSVVCVALTSQRHLTGVKPSGVSSSSGDG